QLPSVRWRSLPEVVRAGEAVRVATVLDAWLAVERARPAFSVSGVEAKTVLRLSGITLDVRLDRVDALADGGWAIVDYKAGHAASSRFAASSRHAFSMRWVTMRVNEKIIDQDDLARQTALDIARSFIVQAPAGSGKTELLIQRFLALLGRVQRPEAIVAMTFTRKAAGEMLERIVAALRTAETGPAPLASHHARTWKLARAALARDAALGWNLTAHPARLQVHTIDALCANLMRQAPLAAKVGAQPQFVENARSMYVE